MQNKTLKADVSLPLPDKAADIAPNIADVENLLQEVHSLLVHSENPLNEDDAKSQAETLEQWLESFRRGLSAAEKIINNSEVLLNEVRKRLTLALEEIQRWDDEGNGVPIPKVQKQRMDAISRAIERIDHLIGSISETFPISEKSKPEVSKVST